MGVANSFYPKVFSLGNVYDDRHIADSKTRNSTIFHDIEQSVTGCKASCEYFQVCGGGFLSNKLSENGSFVSTETLQCRLTVKAQVAALLSLIHSKIVKNNKG